MKKPNSKPKFLYLNKNFAISDSIKFTQPFMTKPVRLRFERMGEETEKEEKKRKASLATIPAFNSKSKVTQSQIDKFKELNQKLLQIKETNNQKINIKGNSNTRKRPCVELEPKANKDASVTTKCTEPKRPQIFEPAQLEEPEHVPQKYKRKLHWGYILFR
ncbi:protein FAM204A [Carex littledalei]|uniref:Protein FAM204A n=1 Tax=Carex littledalei TaxID=544730 RepID=A0A833V6H7_9POAL|nr:protein FAM204A [Carex littledalei]